MASWITLVDSTLYEGLAYVLVTFSFILTLKYCRFPDMTSAGTFILGAAICARLSQVAHGFSSPILTCVWLLLSCLTAVAVCGVAGLVTATLHNKFHIDPLLCGVLSAFSLYAFNIMLLTPAVSVKGKVNLLEWFRYQDLVAPWTINDLHVVQILFFAAIVIFVKLCLDRFLSSEAGLAVRALEDARAGVNVLLKNNQSPEALKTVSLMAANAMVGLGGVLIALKEQQAEPNRGTDIFVTSLIAFLLGTQLHEWACLLSNEAIARGSARWSSVLTWVRRLRITTVAAFGALLYFALVCFTQRLGGNAPNWTRIVLVALIALSLGNPPLVQKWFEKRRRRSAKRSSATGSFSGSSMARRDEVGNGLDFPVLMVKDLEYSYPNAGPSGSGFTFRLDSLEIARGAFVQLSGRNGSGKTTFLRLVAGVIDAPYRGCIVIEGREVAENPEVRRTKVAYVDQDYNRGVVETLTVEENIALADIGPNASAWSAALRADRRSRVREILKHVDLPEGLREMRSSDISGGQRQVVNLLTLLGRRQLPPIVLLDEPVNNLDSENLSHCRKIIDLLHQKGAAILLVSHNVIQGLTFSAPTIRLADPRTTEGDVERIDKN